MFFALFRFSIMSSMSILIQGFLFVFTIFGNILCAACCIPSFMFVHKLSTVTYLSILVDGFRVQSRGDHWWPPLACGMYSIIFIFSHLMFKTIKYIVYFNCALLPHLFIFEHVQIELFHVLFRLYPFQIDLTVTTTRL